MKSFSQNFEDVILSRVFHNIYDGFFIDIGAHHPVIDSVSKHFSNYGWTGIHVEPINYYADLLRKDRVNDIIIESIVSNNRENIEFYNFKNTGLSTSVKSIADGHQLNNLNYELINISSIMLDDIIALCVKDEIHWLKIDVEGMEKNVLEGWSNLTKKPWVLIIESTQPGTQIDNYSEWENIILSKGYRFVYLDGLNRFYLSDNHLDLISYFKYPPNVFDGFQLSIHSNYVSDIVNSYELKIKKLERKIADLKNKIDKI